jgi:hypothetical protein
MVGDDKRAQNALRIACHTGLPINIAGERSLLFRKPVKTTEEMLKILD